MRPIPINASVGMLLSLAIALIVTPWLSLKLLGRHSHIARHSRESGNPDVDLSYPKQELDSRFRGNDEVEGATWLHRLFERVMSPFLRGEAAGKKRGLLFAGMVGLVSVSYTHLDVYKRQPLMSVYAPNALRIEVAVPQTRADAIRKQPQAQVLLADGRSVVPAEVIVFPAVSYTHLDVYKRQH